MPKLSTPISSDTMEPSFPCSTDEPGSPTGRPPTPEIIDVKDLDEGTLLDLTERSVDDERDRVVAAIDFGTTSSAISYVKVPRGCDPKSIPASSVRSIGNYPDAGEVCSQSDPMRFKVPTEIMYSTKSRYYKKEKVSQQAADEAKDDISMHDASDDEDEDMKEEDDDIFRWGYEVQHIWSLPTTHGDPKKCPLSRFKLLLDRSKMTKGVRKQLEQTLRPLKNRRIIKNNCQLITDFLAHLLAHAKSELEKQGIDDSWRFEMVLCVPAIWDQEALRVMQTCLAEAMQSAEFPGVEIQNGCIQNLFIVSEPEAAATYMVEKERGFARGDMVVLLDAGGGTVDAVTYQVESQLPLKLSKEMVKHGGGLCGSSYINEQYRDYLFDRLKDQTQLEVNGVTIRGTVENLMCRIEGGHKRTFDMYAAKKKKYYALYVASNLKSGNGLVDGKIFIPFKQTKKMFENVFVQIGDILKEQIFSTRNLGGNVNKVILIGGFAESPSLTQWVKEFLKDLCEKHNLNPIQLYCAGGTNDPQAVNAVSQGAVLRALDKENGPDRVAKSSYGILRSEPYGICAEHGGQTATLDPSTGESYIQTILWVVKKGSSVPAKGCTKPIETYQLFPYSKTDPLICREVIYVSDKSTQSHYPLDNKKNKGAKEAAILEMDFSVLRDQGHITPIEPKVNKKGKTIGKKHFRVDFEIILMVIDRDLSCVVRWNNKVLRTCEVNIAPGLEMGTM